MKVTNAKQPIVLENVHFEYNEEEQVLKNIDFTIESGKVTAIVGPSGSGKTTLFSLLERFMSQLVAPLNWGRINYELFIRVMATSNRLRITR